MLENWHSFPVSFKYYQRLTADYSDTLLEEQLAELAHAPAATA